MFEAGPVHPLVLAWLLKAPGSLSFFMLSFALLFAGGRGADRELTTGAQPALSPLSGPGAQGTVRE
jgi:hypothetical protein